jgi:DNA repair exonuclease SbcCD ATPase subunit
MEARRVELPHEKNPNAPLDATDSSGLNAANAIPSDSIADRHSSGRSRAERLAEPRARRPQAPEVPVFEPWGGPSVGPWGGPSVEPRVGPSVGPDVHPAGSLSSTSEREEELRRREGELATLSQRLRDRELSLDRERESLNQLKSEVADRHQETLEMRLACEQLWSQLASRMEAPLLVESLAKLRRRLADQYHNAAVEMAQRRDEAREWVARLDERQRELRRQRDEIQTWIYRRHEELEIERLKLLRREQELDARERAQQQQQAEMQRQLGEYQRQIRQLTAQLRCKSELDRLTQ